RPIQLSTVQRIDVNGLGNDDNLIVDSSNGVIPVHDGIHYDGGTGTNQLTLMGQGTTVFSTGPTAGSGSVVIVGSDGTQLVHFANVADNGLQNSVPLPAADPLAAFRAGLEQLTDLSKALDTSTLLGQNLPVLGTSLGRALNGVIPAQADAAGDFAQAPGGAEPGGAEEEGEGQGDSSPGDAGS